MVFSSLSFLYLFFPVVFLGALIKNCRAQNMFLLVASLLFYSWGEPKGVAVMVAITFVAYLSGVISERVSNTSKKKALFLATVVLVVANLLVFKYLGFFSNNLSFLGAKKIELALPIGISFYTFQVLSYVIDLYYGRVVVQKNLLYLLMYVCFFPQLIAGPIVRYKTIEDEILVRKADLDDIAYGLRRFIMGLAKKVIIANQVAKISSVIYEGNAASYGTLMYWIAALSYAYQIYFDFSGYSDMAIGLGRIYGFHFMENFDFPYTSKSVTEFWRRWHISLSTWFRDYVYIPLGGNRCSKARWMFNILVVWALTGFWHGADWNFIIWGLYFAFFLIAEKLLWGAAIKKAPKFLSFLYTAIVVVVGWVIFNETSILEIARRLSIMFSFTNVPLEKSLSAEASILFNLIWLPIAAILSFPVFKKIKFKNQMLEGVIKNGGCLVLLVLSIMFCLSESFNPFIYFRF